MIDNSIVDRVDSEYTKFSIALTTSLTSLNTRYEKEKNDLLTTLKSFTKNPEPEKEKYFLLVCIVFEIYSSFNNSSIFSSFVSCLEGCLKKHAPQVFNQSIPFTSAQKYAVNRMARQLQILGGVTGSLEHWQQHGNPQGVKAIDYILRNPELTDFCKWVKLKSHITALKEKKGRDHYAIELYLCIRNDNILIQNFKLSFQDAFWFDPNSTQSTKQNASYKDIFKPILRLETIEDFGKIPVELQNSILKKMGVTKWKEKNFTIQIIANDEQFIGHYTDRIDAINAGIKLLLNNLPNTNPYKLQANKLITYLDKVARHCKDKLKDISYKELQDINDYQNSLANYTKFIVSILASATGFNEKEVQFYLGRAEDFVLLQRPRPVLCTVMKAFDSLDPEYIVIIDKPENSFSKEIVADFKNILTGNKNEFPKWFIEGFNKQEQALFINILRTIDLNDIKAIYTISSKLRIIPVPSNFGQHTLITYINAADGSKAVIESPSQFRSSHISSRDIFKKDANLTELRYFHAIKNLTHIISILIKNKMVELKKLIEEQKIMFGDSKEIMIPILFQTLISPTLLTKDDKNLHEDKLRAVEEMQQILDASNYILINGIQLKFKIIETNHPLNSGVTIDFTSVETTQPSINFLIQYATSVNLLVQDKLLNLAIKELESTAKVSCLIPGRELHIASLEQLIILSKPCLGISIGSCISNKDRKAIELIYTNVMRVYFEKYAELFKFYDTPENVDKFSKIFAEIYCSKHLQTNAAQNTPGASGIKTPDGVMGYLPNYLQAAIKDWYNIKSKMDPRYQNMNGNQAFLANNLLASNNTLAIKPAAKKSHSPEIWLAPANTNDIIFNPSSPEEWKKLLSELLAKIAYNINIHANEYDCFYIDLLNAPLVTIEQKKVVLKALFFDPNTIFCVLQNYIFRAMGFVCLSDAKEALQSSTKDYHFSSNEILTSIWVASNNFSIVTVENTKMLLNKILPKIEDEMDEIIMPLWKKAYLGVCVYNGDSYDSLAPVNKGISRGYAYANLLDTVHENHKLIVLDALLYINFNGSKISGLQKKVLLALGYSADDVGLKAARALTGLAPGSEESKYSFKIIELLNNFPTLKTLELIKMELNQKFPFQTPAEKYASKPVTKDAFFENTDNNEIQPQIEEGVVLVAKRQLQLPLPNQ